MNKKKPGSLPLWPRLVILAVLAAQVAALFASRLHLLPGRRGNVLAQIIMGGMVVLVVLGAYLWRNYGESFPRVPSYVGLVLLILLMLFMAGKYARRVQPYLALPYDIASWSEPQFMIEILKWHNGSVLYHPPEDSNSSIYTPLVPAVSYFVGKVAGEPLSIPFYRYLLQFYLLLAAAFTAATAWTLVKMAFPAALWRESRWLWCSLFFLFAFLLATNPQTNAFVIFLHFDTFALLVAAVGFWLLVRYAATENRRWLWAMAVFPAIAFLSKQYMVVFLGVYLASLFLEEGLSRKTLVFGAVSASFVAVSVAFCFLKWGAPFRYWAFDVLTSHVIQFATMRDRLVEALPFLFPGFAGGLFLLFTTRSTKIAGLWLGWLVMVLAAAYTVGIAYSPAHLGPATVVGACFFLAGLVRAWTMVNSEPSTSRFWLSWVSFVGGIALLLMALGFANSSTQRLPDDVFRYARDIEKEFSGLPADRVLLDYGEWVYLEKGILMKDRCPILTIHRDPHFGIINRIREHYYRKLLIRPLRNGQYSYELGWERHIEDEIRKYYTEVRRIPAVRGAEDWRYQWMSMSDVIVLEPKS